MTYDRKIAAEKRRATYENKRQRAEQAKQEHDRTIAVLREIRDNPNAKPSDRLQAIAMLSELMPKH